MERETEDEEDEAVELVRRWDIRRFASACTCACACASASASASVSSSTSTSMPTGAMPALAGDGVGGAARAPPALVPAPEKRLERAQMLEMELEQQQQQRRRKARRQQPVRAGRLSLGNPTVKLEKLQSPEL